MKRIDYNLGEIRQNSGDHDLFKSSLFIFFVFFVS
jgi:hypothetical protein